MDFFACCFCDYFFAFPFSNKNLVILFHIDSASITICFDNYNSIVSVYFSFFSGWFFISLLTHFGLSKLTILQYKFIPMSETQMRISVIHSCVFFVYVIFAAAAVKGKQRLNLKLITESTNQSCVTERRVLRRLFRSSLISLYKIELRLFRLQKCSRVCVFGNW